MRNFFVATRNRARWASAGDKHPVLMYHAVMADEAPSLGADPHYAVTLEQFARHLRIIGDAGLQATSLVRLIRGRPTTSTLALTFDDGHRSNRAAAEALAAHGWCADFFVNPTTIGTKNHLGWSDLQAMAAIGMSIQSHGQRHRFLDELTPGEVRAELTESKREIEERLGRPVKVFAPPGGRLAPGLAEAAAVAGYAAVCTSRAGVWHRTHGVWSIPRLAVLRSTSDARFARWIAMEWREVGAQRARHLALTSAKRLLGNERYARLRQGLLRDI